MAFGNQTFTDASAAVGDLLNSQSTAASLRLKAEGDVVEGENYTEASELAEQNEKFTEISTAAQETMAQRNIYKGIGAQTADVAGAGFAESGSALDLLRESASQGGLQKALISTQGLVTEAGYQEQATSYANLASYAGTAAATENSLANKAVETGEITGGINAAAAIATVLA
jgi:hypothetical protein